MPCVFCDIIDGIIDSYVIFENDKLLVVLDAYPSTAGHVLILPKKHYDNIYDIPTTLLTQMHSMAKTIASLQKTKLSADGVNILQNNEAAAGQSIGHFHIHVIPRYKGDGLILNQANKASDESMLKDMMKQLKMQT